MIRLYGYQKEALDRVSGKARCAFYHDMGLGKTFTGGEKLMSFGLQTNLVVCQKSKVGDWVRHFETYYNVNVFDLTGTQKNTPEIVPIRHSTVAVINYDLIHRRELVKTLAGMDYGLLFDESSLLQNKSAKRTKTAMKLAENAKGLVLLSGTPTDGKYERLWTQLKMLGWDISEKLFWRQYVISETTMNQGFPITFVLGYRNEERLVGKMLSYGCDFLKTCDVMELPSQRFEDVLVDSTKEYRRYAKGKIITAFDREFVGDTTFGDMTSRRLLAAAYSSNKLQALEDLLDGTSEKMVVFYNFNAELERLEEVLRKKGRMWSLVNGKTHDLRNFETIPDGVALVQYQAGSMGLNLQAARYCVYYSPPLASSLYEQSKKRIHRIGQDRDCVYYRLISKDTIEEDIYKTLALRKDYTDKLFELGR